MARSTTYSNLRPDTLMQDRSPPARRNHLQRTAKAIQRLLRQHDYEPILFSSAEAFKKDADLEKAVCVILDINLHDGSGIELRYRFKGRLSTSPGMRVLPFARLRWHLGASLF
jgi:hypothetical protein